MMLCSTIHHYSRVYINMLPAAMYYANLDRITYTYPDDAATADLFQADLFLIRLLVASSSCGNLSGCDRSNRIIRHDFANGHACVKQIIICIVAYGLKQQMTLACCQYILSCKGIQPPG